MNNALIQKLISFIPPKYNSAVKAFTVIATISGVNLYFLQSISLGLSIDIFDNSSKSFSIISQLGITFTLLLLAFGLSFSIPALLYCSKDMKVLWNDLKSTSSFLQLATRYTYRVFLPASIGYLMFIISFFIIFYAKFNIQSKFLILGSMVTYYIFYFIQHKRNKSPLFFSFPIFFFLSYVTFFLFICGVYLQSKFTRTHFEMLGLPFLYILISHYSILFLNFKLFSDKKIKKYLLCLLLLLGLLPYLVFSKGVLGMFKAPSSIINNRGYAVFEMFNKNKDYLPLDIYYDKQKDGSSSIFYTKKQFIHGKTSKYYIVSLGKDGPKEKIKIEFVESPIYIK